MCIITVLHGHASNSNNSCSTSWLMMKDGSTISTQKWNDKAWNCIIQHLNKKGNHRCISLSSYTPKTAMCTSWKVPNDKDCHPLTMITHDLTVHVWHWRQQLQRMTESALVPTIQSRLCLLFGVLQDHMRPALWKWCSPGSHAAMAEMCRSFWIFYRKVTGHVNVLVTVSLFFHINLFQCTLNMLMTFSKAYIY